MAHHTVLKIDCPTPSVFARPRQHYQTAHAVALGRLTAIWTQTRTLPAFASGPKARFDDKLSYYDFCAYFEDSTRTLVFTPRAWRNNEEYLLMDIWLDALGHRANVIPLWRWHLVVGEQVRAPPAPNARPSMRRDDRKLLRRKYFLEEGRTVRGDDMHSRSVNPKVTLVNESKWVLEVRLDAGMDWSEPYENDKDEKEQESDAMDSMSSPE